MCRKNTHFAQGKKNERNSYYSSLLTKICNTVYFPQLPTSLASAKRFFTTAVLLSRHLLFQRLLATLGLELGSLAGFAILLYVNRRLRRVTLVATLSEKYQLEVSCNAGTKEV